MADKTKGDDNTQRKQVKLTEAQFSAQIIDLAHYLGYSIAHFRGAWSKDGQRFTTPVQADGKGFPDLVLVRPPRLLFVELKSEDGKTTPEQEAWLELLRETSAEVYLWRPDDFEEIERILK